MTTANELRDEMAAARAELLASLEGVTQEDFVRPPLGEVTEGEQRWPVRDVLWHVGLLDDWFRRMIDQARGGRAIDRFEARRCPAHLNTPELLREWLEQTRHPTLVLLEKLDAEALDRPFTLPAGERRTPRYLLGYLARHDREHAAQVRTLRAPPDA
ncbi:MAG: hypothetical protein GEU80_10050 [Dehalococcoidia bacterium]|nr:hypothetical protein [Dehalococcoidia bacterium]